ncbi:MAG TPA: MraY family glycosyltransferase [Candidatus Saccharimonadia bacterium]|jgi:UDP-GlcNAc:undecaprenyl-phosphate GlcNAc-1-phosphate transferase|nr:MraY family glycosyltransferase [Candidatus Saccharimonadia bacterium]
MMYLFGFGLAFALCAGLTPMVRRFALAHGIVDAPTSGRKIHKREIAYLGGLAIFGAFALVVMALLPYTRQLGALLLGCLVLVVVGVIDDVRDLPAGFKLAAQVAAAGIALGGGIGITSITNPFGGVIDLTAGRMSFDLLGLHFHILPLANTLSLLWMVGLANTINFLDGLDGLAAGVSGIAAAVMFVVAVGANVNQPAVALLAAILAGAALGFLPQNFYPAKIFMGDSGAYFLGLVLAMLSIYSGAKLATAALVLGFPILDAILVAARRIARGVSPFAADRQHFHHLLLDSGMSQRQAVLVIYAIVLAFGVVALASNSLAKFAALIVLVLLAVGITGGLFRRGHRHS